MPATKFVSLISGMVGRRARTSRGSPTASTAAADRLVKPIPYFPELDLIGEMPAVSCWRLRREDCRHYQHRLAIHLQDQINQREDFERLLDRVLAVHVE